MLRLQSFKTEAHHLGKCTFHDDIAKLGILSYLSIPAMNQLSLSSPFTMAYLTTLL